jgi:oligoendopeptidase F
MDSSLPKMNDFMKWDWEQISPYYRELAGTLINEANIDKWLRDWSRIREMFYERYNRHYTAVTLNTKDKEAEEGYKDFLDNIFPPAQKADQELKENLMSSNLEPEGFEEQMRAIRAEAELFQEKNLPLLAEDLKFANEYDKIIGAQTVEWEGEEVTIPQLQPIYQETDREKRERAWRLARQRQLEDRQKINQLWGRFMAVRKELADNAGKKNFRDYRWQQLLRFYYSPEDCQQFHDAIEKVVVPAAERIYEKRRRQIGADTLRPWDLDVDPWGREPLRPFQKVSELIETTQHIFDQVDSKLGEYFRMMRENDLLDLDNRKAKAPGGYCIDFPAEKVPFIFMNAVGIHDDVQTLIHEGGHAFHVFETASLPYHHQRQIGTEIAEIASMSMELLASPYLSQHAGGFYNEKDASRARTEHLSQMILFWPYMAVVDTFQHWVYENHEEASRPENCDRKWTELWGRFMKGVDWRGLEDSLETGWHRKLHIHQVPFYYIDYGLAQLGAIQVWRNALEDQAGAVEAYRRALALGATKPLPELFNAAGAKLAFDEVTLKEAVDLVEKKMEDLEF